MTQVATGGKPRWKLLAGAVVIAAVLGLAVFIGINRYQRQTAENRIPPVPDLSGKTESCRQAIEQADRQAHAAPTSDECVGQLGLLYHANHLYAPADRCYAAAMELNPRSSRWPYYLACLRETSGINEGMESLLRKVVELAPTDGPARLRLADTLWKQNDFDGAALNYEKCLELCPTNRYAMLGLARVAASRGGWEAAQSRLRRAIEVDRTFGPAHRLLATIHDKLGQKEQADASRARASACSRYRAAPEPLLDQLDDLCYDPAYLLVRADTAKQTFDRPRWVALLNRAVEVAPESPAAHEGLGMALRELGNRPEARLHLARAIELDPKILDARVDMGLLLGSLGDLHGAEQALLEGSKYSPTNPSLIYGRGKICTQRGNMPEAAALFLRAAECSDLRFDDAIESYVRCLMLTDQSAEAIAFLQRVLSLRPTAARPRILLARVYANRNEDSKIIAVLREGLAGSPKNSEMASTLASQLASDPDAKPETIREAIDMAAMAVDFSTPADLPERLDTLATAHARAGDFAKATATAEEAILRAREMNKAAELAEFTQHLELFKAGKPFLPPSPRGHSPTTATTRASATR